MVELLESASVTTSAQPLLGRLQAITRDDLARMEAGCAARAINAAIDEDAGPTVLTYGGRTVFARPLNTRRFVQAMARYLCFN
ncbi:MAG: hypothetical protein KBD01_12075 [Acidobacteria bacterium]|nr:hypothetical protein [Acidobacteriota bacterium]